jgi:hypothetical protein
LALSLILSKIKSDIFQKTIIYGNGEKMATKNELQSNSTTFGFEKECWKMADMISRHGKKRKGVRMALALKFGVVKKSRFSYNIRNRLSFFQGADSGTSYHFGSVKVCQFLP